MKLNFWQWLGVVLLLIGIGFWINREMRERQQEEAGKAAPGFAQPPDDATEDPTTQPTTESAATAPAPAP
jgi:hypothetical protein